MSKITLLDPSYKLWLSYSWSNNNHGICGHTYEVVDYYYILKNHFKTGIFLAEDIDWNMFECAIRSKYAFTDEEIVDIKNNTVFGLRPSVVKANNMLFTDGGVVNMSNVSLLCDNVIYFACGNKEIKNNVNPKVWVLQDNRVYETVKVNGINYKKRILFDKLKTIGPAKDALLVYATKNCRDLRNYEELFHYGDSILAITNTENKPEDIEGITFVIPPVDNLFEQFTTYIYTPVNRKWDCSPRFIAECKYYNKQVVFHNIDYWDVDHGLRVRQWDIDNDFNSLYLKPNDAIIDILKNITKR
jgi:hypothetical protein